jgi:serine/threonine protein kinase
MVNKEMFLSSGTLVGEERYKVIKLLGKGGFGAVYLVGDNRFEHKYWALKELLNRFTKGEDRKSAEQMFSREADILSHMSHPSIPGIADFFIENERFYVVMDYINGETLSEYIEKNELLPEDYIMDLMLQLCNILNFLHGRKPNPVVFRDLKPKNIMIDNNNKLYIIDFGLARLFDPHKEKDTIVGLSIGYAPPEQYPPESRIHGAMGKSEPVTDIYAFGATIHHLITGINPKSKPFYFSPISETRPDFSKDLEKIIFRCVEYNMKDRYDSVKDIIDELLELKKKKYPPVTLRLNIKLYKNAINKKPDNLSLYLGLAETYEAMEKFPEALSNYQYFLSLKKDGTDVTEIKKKIKKLEKIIDATVVDDKEWMES